MSPIRLTARRTVGRLRNGLSTAFVVGCFLAVVGARLAFGIEASEGGRLSLVAIWATAAAPLLPVLATFLSMDVISGDRLSGRIDLLLSAAVRERDVVVGKFLGVWTALAAALVASLLTTVVSLAIFAPQAIQTVGLNSFAPALVILLVQGALWCAVGVAASAAFRHASAAAVTSLVLTVALPRGMWAGLMAWSASGRTAWGEMPLDAHVIDIASGSLPFGVVTSYLVVTVLVVFIAAKLLSSLRLVGRGALMLKCSTVFAVVLALVLACAFVFLSCQFRTVLELPVSGAAQTLSPRSRSVLAEAGGTVTVTVFLPRSDRRTREIGRVLRLMKRTSAAMGGVRLELQLVDPRWDIGAAERLVHRGIAPGSVLFERDRRRAAIAVADGYGEREFASAIRRIAAPLLRRMVCWTVGHGEIAADDYGDFGMSDIARDLSRDGYANVALDLSAEGVPADCALVLVAGARNDFSRAELDRLDSFLRGGGRLMVLLGSVRNAGVASLLSAWGLRPVERTVEASRTLSGTDVVVSDFSEHVLAAPLKGSRIVLERPVALAPSTAAEGAKGVDRIGFSPLAFAGDASVAAAVERGAGAGDDLALRPTRIVAVGDATFAMNGSLTARASANRDFFLNCAAYLSGSEPVGVGGEESDVFVSGMDRAARFRHVLVSSVIVPMVLTMALALVAFRRRRRS